MRKIFAYSIIALLSLCAACTRGDDKVGGAEKRAVLELDNDKITVSPDGGEFEVIVRTSDAWTLKGNPGSEWCEPSIVAGEANLEGTAVAFCVDMTYDNREAIFWFECKGVSRQLRVTQQAKAVIFPDENNHFDVPAEGARAELAFDSTYPCTVIIPDEAKSWVEKISTRALEPHVIELNIKANDTYALRETTVTVVVVDHNDVYAEYTISQEQNDAILAGDDNIFNVEATGAKLRIDFQANVEWRLVISEEGEDWINEVQNTRALSDEYVELEVLANEEYSSRSATVKIVGVEDDTLYQEYTIVQAQKDAIIAEIVEHTIDAEGGSVEIEFDTNVDYDIVISEGVDWITLAQEVETRALESRSAVLAIAKNEGYDGREATVKVVMSGNEELYAEYRIIQLQRDAVQAGDSGVEIAVASTGDDITISYLTNVACRVVIPEDIDWISLQQTRGLEAQSVVLNVAANTTHDSREGVVTVESEDGKLSVEYTIIQAQMDDIILDGDKIEATVNGGSVELGYKANIGCEVVIPEEAQAWISVVEPEATRGLEEYNLLLVIAPNPEFESRETTISIKGAGINRDIKVSQEAKRLEVATTEYNIDFEATSIEVDVDTNIEYDVIIAEECDWIEAVVSDDRLVLNVVENATIYDRSATVTLRHGEKDVVLSILQRGDEGVLEVDEEYVVAGLDTEVVVEFKSNFYYEVVIPEECDWLTYPATRAEVNSHSVKFALTTNPKVYNRSADITIMDIKGSVSKVVRITQLGSPLLAVVEVADNEIAYISSDGKIVTPKASSFGSTFMLENKYEDGYGRMLFSDAVTRIGDGVFEGCTTIEQIAIPQSIAEIGTCAFSGCSSLISVSVPSVVATIGSGAFKGCGALRDILFAGNSELGAIGNEVFRGCSSVVSIALPDSVSEIGDSAFFGCSALKEVKIGEQTELVSIGSRAFEHCVALESISIPEHLSTLADRAFAYCRSLTSITLPDSLTSIGGSAFYSCSMLESITLGRNVETIGNSAFSQCVNLIDILLPDSLRVIGNNIFGGCQSLINIAIPDNVARIPECAFLNCSKLENLTFGMGVEHIGLSAFSGCGSLKDIVLPEGVTTIENSAFYGCAALQSVVIPTTATTIGKSAFTGCTGELTLKVNVENRTSSTDGVFYGSKFSKVVIGNNVTAVGDYAFYGCKSIDSVVFGEAVETVGNYSFYGCTSVTSLAIPQGVRRIGEAAFKGCSTLTEVIFAEDSLLDIIDKDAFSGCSLLGSIHIPNGVRTLGNSAFSGCSSTTTVVVPASVNSIGESVFKGCSGELTLNVVVADAASSTEGAFYGNNFTKVVIGSGVDHIGAYAFSDSNTIQSVELCADIATIGDYAFNGCSALDAVTLPKGVTTIGNNAFSGCSALTSLAIPQSVETIGEAAFNSCYALIEFAFAEDALLSTIGDYAFNGCNLITKIDIPAGVNTIGEGAFSGCSNVAKFVIPDSVTNIGKSAFKGCAGELVLNVDVANVASGADSIFYGSKFSNVIVGAGVSEIGDYAFSGCNTIQSIELGADVTTIGKYAFNECASLGSVAVPKAVTTIGAAAFKGCLALADVTFAEESLLGEISEESFSGCSSLKSVAIPALVTAIGDSAFYGCVALEAVNIPAGVKSIGEAAFLGDSAIATITFAEESVLDSIGKEAFRNCSKVRFVEIPNSVTVIAESAFSGCVSLVNAILGTGMQSIGDTAFYGCNRLGIVYSNAIEPPMLGAEVFDDCAEELTIYVPSSSLADYKAEWVDYVRKIVISELE